MTSEESAKEVPQFLVSPSRMVHRGTIEDGADCGQTHEGEWSRFFDEEPGVDAETIAKKYGHPFCSKCFNRSLHLSRLAREARRSI